MGVDGRRITEINEIHGLFIKFYEDHFGCRTLDRRRVKIALVKGGNLLNEEEISSLEKEYVVEEVKRVLFGIPGGKAPGPDGFSSQFFQDC